MSAGLCLEVLIATVVAWVGVWGIVDEAVGIVESRAVRCCLYAALPSTRRCPLAALPSTLAPPHLVKHPRPPHRRTRTEIVITRAGILGLRSRQSSDLGPSKMADRPSYRNCDRNKSSVHAPFSYITRRPGFVVSLAPPHPVQHPHPPHRRTRTEIVITRAGVLGLRSRLARSGPGGPAQPLQVSRLHPHAPCLTCATSPRPTPAPPAPSNPD
jgi:hypothetical protein